MSCEKPVGLNTAQAKEFVEFEAAHPEVKIRFVDYHQVVLIGNALDRYQFTGFFGHIDGFLRPCRPGWLLCSLRAAIVYRIPVPIPPEYLPGSSA